MSLYVAYGSNLNVQQMSYRCPGATVAFTGYLINWKLLYRGSRTGSYATVKRQKGSRVPVAVWNIDSKNEKALDLYEGYPRFYKKRNVFVQLKNGTRKKAMIYLLPEGLGLANTVRAAFLSSLAPCIIFASTCRLVCSTRFFTSSCTAAAAASGLISDHSFLQDRQCRQTQGLRHYQQQELNMLFPHMQEYLTF